jgi:hypothetical protein
MAAPAAHCIPVINREMPDLERIPRMTEKHSSLFEKGTSDAGR